MLKFCYALLVLALLVNVISVKGQFTTSGPRLDSSKVKDNLWENYNQKEIGHFVDSDDSGNDGTTVDDSDDADKHFTDNTFADFANTLKFDPQTSSAGPPIPINERKNYAVRKLLYSGGLAGNTLAPQQPWTDYSSRPATSYNQQPGYVAPSSPYPNSYSPSNSPQTHFAPQNQNQHPGYMAPNSPYPNSYSNSNSPATHFAPQNQNYNSYGVGPSSSQNAANYSPQKTQQSPNHVSGSAKPNSANMNNAVYSPQQQQVGQASQHNTGISGRQAGVSNQNNNYFGSGVPSVTAPMADQHFDARTSSNFNYAGASAPQTFNGNMPQQPPVNNLGQFVNGPYQQPSIPYGPYLNPYGAYTDYSALYNNPLASYYQMMLPYINPYAGIAGDVQHPFANHKNLDPTIY